MLVVLAAGLAAIVASSLWDRSVAPVVPVVPVTSGTSEPADIPATDTPIEASPLDESSLEDAGIAYNSLTWLSRSLARDAPSFARMDVSPFSAASSADFTAGQIASGGIWQPGGIPEIDLGARFRRGQQETIAAH
jgi:hypothetical protein